MIKLEKTLTKDLFRYRRNRYDSIFFYLPNIKEKLLLINKLLLPLEIKINIKDEWIKEEMILNYIDFQTEYNILQEEYQDELDEYKNSLEYYSEK